MSLRNSLTPQVTVPVDEEPQSYLPKRVASGTGLPQVWTESMNREVAYWDGYGEVDHRNTIRRLKSKNHVLTSHIITAGSISRQVEYLEKGPEFSQWFRAGNNDRIKQLQAKGIHIPDFDISKIPLPAPPKMLDDLEIFGSNAPMTGALAPYAPGEDDGSEDEHRPSRVAKHDNTVIPNKKRGKRSQTKKRAQTAGEHHGPGALADRTNSKENSGGNSFGINHSLAGTSSPSSLGQENQRLLTIHERRLAKRMAAQQE